MRVTYNKKYKKRKIKKTAKEIIYVPQDAGFFANYNTIVTHLMNKQKNNIVRVDLSTKHLRRNHDFKYDDGNKNINVWTEFFYQIPSKKHKNITYEKQYTNRTLNRFLMHGNIQEARKKNDFSHFFYDLWQNEEKWRDQAYQTIQKYIKLKKHMINKLKNFETKYMQNKNIIGVHVRYMTKAPDQVSQKMPEYKDYIRRIKDNYDYKNSIIFLATDHIAPIEIFEKEFKDNLVYQENIHRIETGKLAREIHKRIPKLVLAEEVIMDCYLMSQCNVLVHTLSNVSLAASCINKNLKNDLLV